MGWSQAALADRVGVDRGTIKRIESGKQPPKMEIWEKIRGVLEISPDEASDEVQKIGVYGLAGAGPAWDLTAFEPLEEIWVPRRLCGASIVAVKVHGRSMEPVIFDGAYVGVDREDRKIISGEIYAVWLPNEGAVVKRLYAEPSRLALVSDNPTFPRAEIPAGEVGPDLVLGRVRWILQEL